MIKVTYLKSDIKNYLLFEFLYFTNLSYFIVLFFFIQVRPDYSKGSYAFKIPRWLKSLTTPESIGIYLQKEKFYNRKQINSTSLFF